MCAANALSFSSPPLSFPPPPLEQKQLLRKKVFQQDLSSRQAGDQGPQRDSTKVTPYPLPDQRPYHLATKSGLYCVTGGVGVWPPPPPAVIAAAAATTAESSFLPHLLTFLPVAMCFCVYKCPTVCVMVLHCFLLLSKQIDLLRVSFPTKATFVSLAPFFCVLIPEES